VMDVTTSLWISRHRYPHLFWMASGKSAKAKKNPGGRIADDPWTSKS
jgi:hypothetical protein